MSASHPVTQPDRARSVGGGPGRPRFMIATGIECSYPTVQGGQRRDELRSTGHYDRWREDFALCLEVGARYVRYGIPYYTAHLGPGRYDWTFADEVLPVMRDMGLTPIVDLCHFGVPDWVGGFANSDWPPHFAEYCSAFAARYPWIQFYTPINEMLVCARFSGKTGDWNEQQASDRGMVDAHVTMCRATLLGIEAILARRPDAVFIQSEVAEAYIALAPNGSAIADFHNEWRFITFDHLFGRPPRGDVVDFLLGNGVDRRQLDWFVEHGRRAADHCVLGMDYYAANEKVIGVDGKVGTAGEMLGWHTIALDYYHRYRRPLMLTETNAIDDGKGAAERWLKQTWCQAHHLRTHGVPVIGFTWFSLTDQIDWDIQLVRIENKVTPNGLCTLDRKLRPVGELFKQLAIANADEALVLNIPAGLMTQ